MSGVSIVECSPAECENVCGKSFQYQTACAAGCPAWGNLIRQSVCSRFLRRLPAYPIRSSCRSSSRHRRRRSQFGTGAISSCGTAAFSAAATGCHQSDFCSVSWRSPGPPGRTASGMSRTGVRTKAHAAPGVAGGAVAKPWPCGCRSTGCRLVNAHFQGCSASQWLTATPGLRSAASRHASPGPLRWSGSSHVMVLSGLLVVPVSDRFKRQLPLPACCTLRG